MALFLAGVFSGLLIPIIIRLVEDVLEPQDPWEWYDNDELWTGTDVRRKVYGPEEE